LSGNKMYGPTGAGALYGRVELLAALPRFMGGGEMVKAVSFAGPTYADPPHRFEAGTPNIEGAIGLAAAVDYLATLDRAAVAAHEQDLLARATGAVAAQPRARVVGRARDKAPILSF